MNENQIIINTTPLGMYPAVNFKPEIPYQFINKKSFVIDLIYNPEETLFLKLAKEKGATTLNGYKMLIEQAEASWDIWNK